MFMYIKIHRFHQYSTVIKTIYHILDKPRASPSAKQTNIYDRLYNSSCCNIRFEKSNRPLQILKAIEINKRIRLLNTIVDLTSLQFNLCLSIVHFIQYGDLLTVVQYCTLLHIFKVFIASSYGIRGPTCSENAPHFFSVGLPRMACAFVCSTSVKRHHSFRSFVRKTQHFLCYMRVNVS